MKQRMRILGIILCLALSACGGEQPPTLSAADVGATAQSAAFTMVAATQQAIPTNTPLPPTETPTSTPLPTDTPTSTPTTDPLLPTVTFTSAPQSSAPTSAQDNCNKTLTSWQGPTVKFLIANETKPKGTIVLSMYVVTDLGECGYIYVTGSAFSGPEGYYSAGAFVDGKKDFKVFGGFPIKGGSWTIIIRNESIVAKGGCYPNC